MKNDLIFFFFFIIAFSYFTLSYQSMLKRQGTNSNSNSSSSTTDHNYDNLFKACDIKSQIVYSEKKDYLISRLKEDYRQGIELSNNKEGKETFFSLRKTSTNTFKLITYLKDEVVNSTFNPPSNKPNHNNIFAISKLSEKNGINTIRIQTADGNYLEGVLESKSIRTSKIDKNSDNKEDKFHDWLLVGPNGEDLYTAFNYCISKIQIKQKESKSKLSFSQLNISLGLDLVGDEILMEYTNNYGEFNLKIKGAYVCAKPRKYEFSYETSPSINCFWNIKNEGTFVTISNSLYPGKFICKQEGGNSVILDETFTRKDCRWEVISIS